MLIYLDNLASDEWQLFADRFCIGIGIVTFRLKVYKAFNML